MPIKIVIGDITTLNADAVVNAANGTLLGGGGVDGAIHRAAGPDLRAYCARLGGCATGDAVLTPGFLLPAKYVIHTVGPIYDEVDEPEELLRQCYEKSLGHVTDISNNINTVAFPAISTGVFGFPKDLAAKISSEAISAWLKENPEKEVWLVFLNEEDAIHHRRILNQ